MRILITGATGFVGAPLCRALIDGGHEVVVLSRSPEIARERMAALHGAYPWDPMAGPPPAEAFDGVDAVVHLAGEPVTGRWTAAKKAAIRDTRIVGTRNLVAAMKALPERPGSLVSASAIGFYGDRGDAPLTESALPGDDFLAETCRAWEAEAQAAESFGVRAVSLRIGIVIGAGGGALEAMLPPFRLGLGGPLGSGRQWWSWIHRDDLVAMIQRAAGVATTTEAGPETTATPMRGVYNATAPNPVRQREFARVLGAVLRRPAFLPAPAPILKLVLGGFSIELLSSKQVLPQRMQDAGFQPQYPELEAALRAALT
jgi:uncharacterized protein (TIGR01777 family)